MNLFPKSNYELILYQTETCYNQSDQDSSIEFSLCRKEGDTYIQCFYPVTCRELLCQALGYFLSTGIKVNNHDVFASNELVNITALSIYLNSSDECNLSKNIHLLNNLEIQLNKEPTQIYDCSNNNYLVLLSSFWLQSGLTLSIYSYFLRLLTYKTCFGTMMKLLDKIDTVIEDYLGYDMDRLRYFRKNIDIMFLLQHMDEVLGDSPITGVNDKEYFSKIEKQNDPTTSTLFVLTHNNSKMKEVDFYASNIGDFGGFSTFAETVYYLKEVVKAGYELTPGYAGSPFELWAYNYVLLTQDK